VERLQVVEELLVGEELPLVSAWFAMVRAPLVEDPLALLRGIELIDQAEDALRQVAEFVGGVPGNSEIYDLSREKEVLF